MVVKNQLDESLGSGTVPMASAPSAPVAQLGFQLLLELPAQEGAISSLKFSPNGQWLASSAANGVLTIWSACEGKHIKSLKGHKVGVTDIGWSHDSLYLVSSSDDQTLKTWNITTGRRVHTLIGHKNFVFSCNYDHKSNHVASGCFNGVLKKWNAHTGECIMTRRTKYGTISSVQFSSDDSQILTSTCAGVCLIWDASSGQCLSGFKDDSNAILTFAKFTSLDDHILLGTMKSSIKLWSKDGVCKKLYQGYENENYCIVANLSYSKKRKACVISGSEDGIIYIWDLQSTEIVQKLHGHTDVVMCTDSHPTEDIIASGGLDQDRRIILWKNGGST